MDADTKHASDMATCDEQLTSTAAKNAMHVAAAETCVATIAATEDLLATAE
jgi:hypothetical protein